VKKVCLSTLRFKLGYLLRTCPQSVSQLPLSQENSSSSRERCRVCAQPCTRPCANCLTDLIRDPIKRYKDFTTRADLAEILPKFDKDPRLDLTIVMVSVLLTFSGIGRHRTELNAAPLRSASTQRILQAALLLELQRQRFPDHVPLRLLLIRLYLLLGCASLAYQLWAPMEVKRTILDALGPLFFDRLSSVAPTLFIGTRPVIDPVLQHYNFVLADRHPLRIWDAFASGSYSSILDIVEYDDRIRRSCAMVMSVVEDRRATRAFAGKLETFDEAHLVADITDDTILADSTDYGSFPNLESSFGPPLHDFIRLGPPPSNERSHLALLAERFYDLVTFKPPKDYKPTKVNVAAAQEREYNTETLLRLSNSFSRFLHAEAIGSKLTQAEHGCFTALSLLSSTLLLVFSTPKAEPLPASFTEASTALRACVSDLRDTVLMPITARADGTNGSPPSTLIADPLFPVVTDPHSLSTLRETALALRHAATFALSFHEREVARDRTGKSNLHKEAVAELKAIDKLGTEILVAVKARVKEVKDRLGEGGWLDRMAEWTFGSELEREGSEGVGDEVTKAVYGFVTGGEDGVSVVEEWAGRIVESWREGWKGLGMVRMDI
jgi:N-terminal acetyltransferase B complex non-catalytic subunit